MSDNIWNPGKILQIFVPWSDSILCLGQCNETATWPAYSRCEEDIYGESTSDERAAHTILRIMAVDLPTSVTDTQLLELANYCLCIHHKDQLERVAGTL